MENFKNFEEAYVKLIIIADKTQLDYFQPFSEKLKALFEERDALKAQVDTLNTYIMKH